MNRKMMDKIVRQTELEKDSPVTSSSTGWKSLLEDINKYNDIQIRNFIKSFLMEDNK